SPPSTPSPEPRSAWCGYTLAERACQARHEPHERLRQRGAHAQRLARARMRQLDRVRVQAQPLELRAAVGRVSDERMADRLQVYADLMRPARLEHELDGRDRRSVERAVPERAHVRAGRIALLAV